MAINRALDDVAQLSHIAGPGIGLELGHCRAPRSPASWPIRARPPCAAQNAPPATKYRRSAPAMEEVSPPRTTAGREGRLEICPGRPMPGRFSLVAATMRTSTLIGLDAPIRVISPYSTARNSRSCAGDDKVANSSRNKVPPSASSKRPCRVFTAPVKLPGFVAEQLRLDQIFRKRRAVHRDQRARPARRQVMEALGNQLLAGAALADHQNGPVERRGTARPLDCVEKGKALPDELFDPLHSPSDQKSDRLLVLNPISWQDVSGRFSHEN